MPHDFYFLDKVSQWILNSLIQLVWLASTQWFNNSASLALRLQVHMAVCSYVHDLLDSKVMF